jgi:hypothetical protein
MNSFAGSITALFVAGMVGGYAGLCLLGPTDETQTMAVAAAPIPNPPALPCSMQAWPNADRKCLDWTAPREAAEAKTEARTMVKTEAKTDGAQKAVASTPSPDQRATTPAQPSTVGMSVAATQPAAEAAADAPAAQVAQVEAPAKAAVAKPRTAAHAKSKALAVMRGFGDNLNDVRLNAYAYDGSSRRSATRSVQDKNTYGARSGGWWW